MAAQDDPGKVGGLIANDCMSVLGNAEHPVLAHAFINYVLDAEVALENMGWLGYQPPQKTLDPKKFVEDGLIPENLSSAVVEQGDFEMGQIATQLTPDRRNAGSRRGRGSSKEASGVSGPASDEGRAIGEQRWLWPSLAVPGVVWLVLLFLVPLYAVFSPWPWDAGSHLRRRAARMEPPGVGPEEFVTVFGELFTGQLGIVFIRTIIYVIVATILSLLIGYPVAYYLARHAGRFRVLLLVLIIAPFWINYLMRMLAWVNLLSTDGYVNQTLMFVGILDEPREWLVGKHSTVILGLVYGYVPFLILPLFAALDRIDRA